MTTQHLNSVSPIDYAKALGAKILTKAQGSRFVRLFVAALLPQLVAVGGNYTRDVVVAAIVGSAEVAFRVVFPVASDPVVVPVTPVPVPEATKPDPTV